MISPADPHPPTATEPEPTTEAERFLLGFHRRHAGVTTRAFAGGRDAQGRSSYDLLCATVTGRDSQILDLGCGDGYLLEQLVHAGHPVQRLLGVDMSASELRAARARSALADVPLLCERAQSLSLGDRSIDHVLSHLAFMLMDDVEQVVGEIARILRPGGRFATVVGGGPKLGDAFELFLDLLQPVYDQQTERIPRLGDRRTRSDAGLAELFHPGTGFAHELSIRDYPISLSGPFEQVWTTLSTIYELQVVPAERVAGLRERFQEGARTHLEGDVVRCTMAVRLVVCERLPDAR